MTSHNQFDDFDECIDAYVSLDSKTQTRRVMDPTRIKWVEQTLENSDDYYMFRMQWTVFWRLHESIVTQYELQASRGFSKRRH